LKLVSDASCARFIKYSRQGTKKAKATKYQARKGVNDRLRSSYIIGRLIVINSNVAANLKEAFLPNLTANVLIFAVKSAS
jgi:hypothetical protein